MGLPDYSILQWCILSLCALIIGVSKTGMPGGGILVVPLVALVIPAKASTGVILPMLIAGDIFAVFFYRRHADWKHLIMLIPWSFAGIVLGYIALGLLSDAQLRPLIGVAILAMLGLNQWRAFRNGAEPEALPKASKSFAAAMGIAGGATTMMANAAGPVIALYMLAMRLPKAVFVGTSAWFFMIMNVTKVPFSAHLGLITRETLALNFAMLPLIVVGAFGGIHLLKRLPEGLFNRIVIILAALAAVKLLF